MSEIGRDIALARHLDPDQAHAAATTLRRIAARNHASKADVDTVLNAVFAEPISDNARQWEVQPARLTPEQKDQVRALLATGLTDTDVAQQIGCARQRVASIRYADHARAARAAKQTSA